MMKRPSVQSSILFAAVHTLAESNGFIRANWWAGCRRHPRVFAISSLVLVMMVSNVIAPRRDDYYAREVTQRKAPPIITVKQRQQYIFSTTSLNGFNSSYIYLYII
jgi:hypothetical protein